MVSSSAAKVQSTIVGAITPSDKDALGNVLEMLILHSYWHGAQPSTVSLFVPNTNAKNLHCQVDIKQENLQNACHAATLRTVLLAHPNFPLSPSNKCHSGDYSIERRSGTYGSRATCGSFQDSFWLSGSQTDLSRISSKHCKTANTSKKTFQSYHYFCLQLPHTPIGQVSIELEDFVFPSYTNAQFYGPHKKPFLNMRLPWFSQPKRFLTPAIENTHSDSVWPSGR